MIKLLHFALLILLSIGYSQTNNPLETYSLEDFETALTNANSSSETDIECTTSSVWLCKLFPFLNNQQEQEEITITYETIVEPFYIFVDREAVFEYLNPIAHRAAITDLYVYDRGIIVANLHFGEDVLEERIIDYKSASDKTSVERIQELYNWQYKQNLSGLLKDYSNGFFEHDTEFKHYIEVWSDLKQDKGPLWIFSPRQGGISSAENYVSRQKAVDILGSNVKLVRTINSLYFENNRLNETNIKLDEYIWVNSSDAIGMFTNKRYKVVSQAGELISLFEDEVLTKRVNISINNMDFTVFKELYDLQEVNSDVAVG